VRADGVQLLGAHRGSGYRVPPALVQRADGQVIQLTPLLYSVLDAVDGERTEEDLARAVSAATGRTVVAEDVRTLVDGRLSLERWAILPAKPLVPYYIVRIVSRQCKGKEGPFRLPSGESTATMRNLRPPARGL